MPVPGWAPQRFGESAGVSFATPLWSSLAWSLANCTARRAMWCVCRNGDAYRPMELSERSMPVPRIEKREATPICSRTPAQSPGRGLP
mgnify:CR=1 FL=1